MIRRALASLAASLAVAACLVAGSATPAAAIGGETFGCRVAPGSVLTWETYCTNTKPARVYNAGFAVLNTSGGGYTYDWNISGDYLYVIVGCTPATYDCAVAVRGNAGEKQIEVFVTYTKDGQSATGYASAYISG